MSIHIRALVTRPLSHSKVTCDTNLFTREIKSSLITFSVNDCLHLQILPMEAHVASLTASNSFGVAGLPVLSGGGGVGS